MVIKQGWFTAGLLLVLGCLTLMGGIWLFFRNPETESSEVGAITVYTTLNESEALVYLRDFQLVFPQIEVNLVRQPINQLVARLLAEQESVQADVVWGVGLRNMLLLEWNDLLTPYAPVGSARLRSRFIDTRTPPYWSGLYISPTAFCINSDAAARRGLPTPRSWRDLIKPAYRRSLIMPNPTTSTAGLAVVLAIFELYGEQDAWRYLDELQKNIATYTENDTTVCQMVGRGDYPIGITDEHQESLQMIYPSEGSGWEMMVSGLVRKDSIHPAARTFLDWAVSKSVMPLYAHKSPLTAMKTGASLPITYPSDAEAQLLEEDPSWGAANRSRILREWQRRYGG